MVQMLSMAIKEAFTSTESEGLSRIMKIIVYSDLNTARAPAGGPGLSEHLHWLLLVGDLSQQSFSGLKFSLSTVPVPRSTRAARTGPR